MRTSAGSQGEGPGVGCLVDSDEPKAKGGSRKRDKCLGSGAMEDWICDDLVGVGRWLVGGKREDAQRDGGVGVCGWRDEVKKRERLRETALGSAKTRSRVNPSTV